jgi:transposase
MKTCPSDLTDNQWQVMKDLFEQERKRKHSLWSIVNAILYMTKSGCQWRGGINRNSQDKIWLGTRNCQKK